MPENTIIARPYAKAIFNIAVQDNKLQEWSDRLFVLANLISDPKINAFLADPRVNWQGRAEVFVAGCSKILDQHGKNFIKTLTLHRRLPYLPDIYELYEKLRLRHEQVVKAQITSAIKLDEKQKEKLQQALQKRLQIKITAQYEEDEKLLGGVIIRVGDRVIDGSVRSKLRRLRKYLWH
jgi:F-type H+-transporting ATPase subunit delta